MPLFEYKCQACGWSEEDIQPHTVKEVPCEKCGGVAHKLLSLPARTQGRWGDSNGFYSNSFGRYFDSTLEMDRYATAHGYVHLDDVGGDKAFTDSVWNNAVSKEQEVIDKARTITDNMPSDNPLYKMADSMATDAKNKLDSYNTTPTMLGVD